ncbi:aspartate kinase [Lophiostoma macrostomum CBS 122681]|uniref:Aspartokinase n=1 Tax=Lophiostoma macrostomum CBS 122681 TaxID=1314788 RepID=A0A6A6TQD8_9PLEO|nr:aspartate kinase [Lophiostoma macrostomum CBS 122681]
MPETLTNQWIVQKYGGTSLGKLLHTITGSIVPEYLTSYSVAVVCSARSSTSKSQGTTSLLLDAIRLATSSETDTVALDEVIDAIKKEHLQAAQDAIDTQTDAEILQDLQLAIKKDCEQLRSFLKATWTLGEISDRTQDKVLAVGETLSCRIVAGSLRGRGFPAQVVILDGIVQQAYGRDHRHLMREFKSHPAQFLQGLTQSIQQKLLQCEGTVPVITGFFGAMPDSLINSVGRGYSDLCAALCAVAMNAKELQIWKEVDGIFTADPRKIKSARLLATITSEEAAELTYYGSEVIHPLTIEQLDASAIPLRLKNVTNPAGSGTIIYPSRQSSTSSRGTTLDSKAILHTQVAPDFSTFMDAKSTFMTANGYYGEANYRRTPTAVTVKEGITVLNIRSNGMSRPQAFLASVGAILERHDITIDLISSSQQMLSLAVCCTKPERVKDATAEMSELGYTSIVECMSIVTVVGHKMRNMVGISGEIFNALASARVNIYLISQGASEINISFVVKAQDALLATEVIHTNVMRIPLHSEQENSFIKGPWLY